MAGLLLLPHLAFAADPVASLPQDVQSRALSQLQHEFIDFETLHVKAGETLESLVARSGGELNLQPGKECHPDSNTAAGILTALLPGNVIYCRLANFTPKTDWKTLSGELHQWMSQGSPGVVLDARSNVSSTVGDYVQAAQLAGLFDKGPLLFSAKGYEPLWNTWCDWTVAPNADILGNSYALGKGRPSQINDQKSQPLSLPVVVLINHQTSGAGEALAATLQTSGALVFGQATAGRAGIYQPIQLTDALLLNSLTARIYLADGSLLWGRPVLPDLTLTIDARTEKGALILIKNNRVLEVIQESAERHRMSEAALVQGEDPEWDDYVATLEKKPDDHYMSLPPIRDEALISALDSLKAIHLAQGWPKSPPQTSAVLQ